MQNRVSWLPLLLFLSACPGDAPSSPDAGPGDAGLSDGSTLADSGPPRRPESELAAMRQSCAFGRGAMPWETIGQEHPIGEDIPIRHWFIFMQENRSFDHYFGAMPGVDGLPPGGMTNPDTDGTPVPTFHSQEYCTEDVGHGWNDGHQQWNNGANDGFVVNNNPDGARAMGWYDATDLPFYYDLYSTFAMSDRHFCSVLGPTWTNRDYFVSATSFGTINNVPIPMSRLPTDGGDYLILAQLDRAGHTWRVYRETIGFYVGAFPNWAARRENFSRQFSISRFLTDLAAGDVAEVNYLEPTWDWALGADATDEHPHANVQLGQQWVARLMRAIMASPVWRDSAIVLTYDEWGGFYDHVPPPEACHPGDFPPDLEPGGPYPGDFDRYGFRVPLVIVSPWSRPGYVSHQVTDHASVVRLLQARYLMPAMTGRDANAWPLLDMFDFSERHFETPPELDEAVVSQTELDECHARFP